MIPLHREPVLEIKSLNVYFRSKKYGYLHAIRELDLSLHNKEVLGLVGESGSGKSVTCLAAMRLLPPVAEVDGQVLFKGENILTMPATRLDKIRGGQVAMISQDPIGSLNPVHSVGRQIKESLYLHHALTGHDAQQKALALLQKVGISAPQQRLKEYPHQLSGGMCQRVMIAMALAGNPAVLIADEPTTALDVTIQAQILDLIRQAIRDTGTSVILITHDLGVVAENCDCMAVLYGGRVAESGPVELIFRHPRHPYTQGLMASLPSLDGRDARLTPIKGTVPALPDLPAGCAFSTRCEHVMDGCRRVQPDLKPTGTGNHLLACHLDR